MHNQLNNWYIKVVQNYSYVASTAAINIAATSQLPTINLLCTKQD